jgi:hypothetical protein
MHASGRAFKADWDGWQADDAPVFGEKELQFQTGGVVRAAAKTVIPSGMLPGIEIIVRCVHDFSITNPVGVHPSADMVEF